MSSSILANSLPLVFPATVLIDHRERHPYSFTGFGFTVHTRTATLASGDYSLDGHADHGIAVERKSLSDLYATIAHRRRAFEEELKRLSSFLAPAVAVEATWEEVCHPPASVLNSTRIPAGAITNACRTWQQMFPNILWGFRPDRRAAERLALWLMYINGDLFTLEDGTIAGLLNGDEDNGRTAKDSLAIE